jgi:hypothetical protein
MYAFFLGPIKHNLINRFSEETFSKTTNGIFGICFIQNFNDVFALKYSEKAHNLSMTFMSEWTYMLQYPRAKNISNNCCTLEKQYPFSKKKLRTIVFSYTEDSWSILLGLLLISFKKASNKVQFIFNEIPAAGTTVQSLL